MEEKELNLEELEHVNASPNQQANFESAINNEDLYRKKQIEELKDLREKVLNQSEEKNKTR